jgi:hypothetical protein
LNFDWAFEVLKRLSHQFELAKSGMVSVTDRERPNVDPLKCPVMLNVLCKRAWCVVEMYPVWPIWSRDLAPSTLSTYPPPHLPGALGTQFTGSLQEGWTWTGGVKICSQPNTDPVIADNVPDIIFIPSRKLFLERLSNDCLPSTDCCYIF